MSLSTLIGIGQGSAVYAPADLIAGAVVWLIALAATVLLFTGRPTGTTARSRGP